MSGSKVTYNQVAGTSVHRIAGLSDALFGIALTLTVLEVRIPRGGAIMSEGELRSAVFQLGPRLLAYLLSFMTIGIFWVGEATFLSHLKRSDRHLTWILLAYLAAIAVMPISTGLLADYITYRTALLLYWLNILAIGLLSIAAIRYGQHAGLVNEGIGEDAAAALKRRLVVGQALYAFGVALCIFNTYWSITFIVLIQMYYAFAPRIPRRARGKHPARTHPIEHELPKETVS